MNAILAILALFVSIQIGVTVFFLYDLYRAGVRNFKQFVFRKWWNNNQIRFIVIQALTVPGTLLLYYLVQKVLPDVVPELSGLIVALLGGTAGSAMSKRIPKGKVTTKAGRASLVDIAKKELGVSEIKGEKHNARIVQYAHDIGLSWITDDETPWCAVFLNWVLFISGRTGTGSARAKSFSKWGVPATAEDIPSGNVVAIFHRGSSASDPRGHVGVVISDDGGYINLIGGNQGDSVSIKRYKKDWRFAGYRKPE